MVTETEVIDAEREREREELIKTDIIEGKIDTWDR